MNTCIICDKKNDAKSIEHIVPESFGNKHYVMEKGKVCDECNGRISKYEAKALSNSIFLLERARSGVKTKKGKNVKGILNELDIEGHPEFVKQYVSVKGLNKDNVKDFDPETKQFSLIVNAFDKSEVMTSKFLLAMGIESLYASKRKVYEKYDFTELEEYLTNKSNYDWGFITAKWEKEKFISIPAFIDKHRLKKKRIELSFYENSKSELLFKFQYAGISMIINLLNRELKWVEEYKEHEEYVSIFPDHLEKKKNTPKED